MSTSSYDAIILGAGGAGLFCAGIAAQRGRRVLVLDHAAAPGEKIRISGGGRCNFTNLHATAADFLSDNPHFAKSALKRYTQADFIALVEKHGIAWHEKTLGQLFCDGSSRQIVQLLLDEAQTATIQLATPITAVAKTERGFRIGTGGGAFEAARLVLATGGPSIPKMGATGFAYEVAKQFGLRVIAPKPALVPLTFSAVDAARWDGMAGVAVPDAIASLGKRSFREAVLFTHRGLSGPAILQISSYWEQQARAQPITLDLCPGVDLFAELKAARAAHPKQELATQLERWLPARLARRLAELGNTPGRIADLSDAKLRGVAMLGKAWQFVPAGSEGYAKAEVTLGGIDTAALSSQTMEVSAVPGLHVIGEAVDVTGHLGGFNFQWAWSSGFACGQAL
ncbi:NAD(P)/FAD-dependent oxidoreductase [Ferrovibrio sp.]|uniref:NAD(P)/FAD-dependent oxidoreductase n=1 Tax=Ferrovibrio sp. TaxID=1917215 RepID=UPI000CB69CA4|nr:NAD(P)/FAD-dependent oxidoreductase [Ferrovibrio sp.]PJI37345.1 MAG: aminoacetone oxidase family FAD-binding enzyme [Ferrovibrio sp.]